MSYTCYQTSHIGARGTNQDYSEYCLKDDWGCFAVADGLGGHQQGEIAATEVVKALIQFAPKFNDKMLGDDDQGMREFVATAVEFAQKKILKEHQSLDTQTTLCLAWLNPKQIITAHVGDSRVYRLNKSEILWRTADHSEVQLLFEQGKIKEKEFSTHPLQNQLLRSISMFEPAEVDISLQPPLADNESIILCTDGFWGACTEEDLVKLSRNHGSTEKKISDMIPRFLEEQGADCDNITIQVVKPD